MRDVLGDTNGAGEPTDPMRKAQVAMRTPLPKRFYKGAGVEAVDGGFAVTLDGKAARTPVKAALRLPTAEAARLVAAEFDGQGEFIDPMSMPVMRLANTAIDGVANDTQAVLEDILRFASSDLVCYRANAPEALVERQAAHWDRYLDWVRAAFGARFALAEGVMHVEQPRETIAALGMHLRQREEAFRLAALHLATSLSGSALIALALEAGEVDAQTAWRDAHVDEDWNIEQWGEDAEAAARRAMRWRDMQGAAALLGALR